MRGDSLHRTFPCVLDLSIRQHRRARRHCRRIKRNMQGERTCTYAGRRDNTRLGFYERFRAAKGHFPHSRFRS